MSQRRRCQPPELTGDPHTDWILWELSLILSEIAHSRHSEQVECGHREDHANCPSDRRNDVISIEVKP